MSHTYKRTDLGPYRLARSLRRPVSNLGRPLSFYCFDCDRPFRNGRDLREHVQAKHESRRPGQTGWVSGPGARWGRY
jgi:hypothetical protein